MGLVISPGCYWNRVGACLPPGIQGSLPKGIEPGNKATSLTGKSTWTKVWNLGVGEATGNSWLSYWRLKREIGQRGWSSFVGGGERRERRGSKLWERTGSFFLSREEESAWEIHMLDRSLPLPCGFGEQESRMGAGNLLKVIIIILWCHHHWHHTMPVAGCTQWEWGTPNERDMDWRNRQEVSDDGDKRCGREIRQACGFLRWLMGPGTEGRNTGKENKSVREMWWWLTFIKYLYGPGIVPRVFHESSHNFIK